MTRKGKNNEELSDKIRSSSTSVIQGKEFTHGTFTYKGRTYRYFRPHRKTDFPFCYYSGCCNVTRARSAFIPTPIITTAVLYACPDHHDMEFEEVRRELTKLL